MRAIGRLDDYGLHCRELLVTLRGQHQVSPATDKPKRSARLFIESHAQLDELASANGATWLDCQLVSDRPERLASRGFGAEVEKSLRRRQPWLVREGLMSEQGGKLIARRQLLAALIKRDVESSGADLKRNSD